jgi:hypothetical protein
MSTGNEADLIAALSKEVLELRAKLYDDAPAAQDEAERPYVLLPVEHFLAAGDPPEYVVEGLFEERSVIGLVAPPESGKSLFMLDVAACVALGRPFHARQVKHGLVVYLAGEGHSGLRARVQALEGRYGFGIKSVPLVIAKAPASLLDVGELNRVRTAIQAAIARYDLPLALLVIDTLARFIAPGDESKALDMGQYLNAIDALRGAAAAVSLHHPGHGDNTRGRGSSSWKAGLDAEFSIANDGGTITVNCSKMKDGPKPDPFSFRIEPAPTRMTRADGSAVQSVVLTPTDAPANVRPPATGKNQKRLLAELERINKDGTVWAEGELREIGRGIGMHRNSARDAVLGLRQLGYLQMTIGGSRLSLSDEPK